jgi:hypothetical protein
LEAAYMARDIYRNNNTTTLFGGWKFERNLANSGGLRIGLYRRVYGPPEFAVVNRGTANIRNWLNNATQLVALSSDVTRSINVARDFVDKNPKADITFVGHSKGGAEAVANARATGKGAIAFNPAEISTATTIRHKLDTGRKSNIREYVVTGDILDVALRGARVRVRPFNHFTYLRMQHRPPLWTVISPISLAVASANAAAQNHSIDAVKMLLGGR